VLCGVGLAERVQGQLNALGLDVRAEEVEPGDEAEDVFDSLISHLAGRRPASEPPSSEDWWRLYAQILRYLERRPWERWADDVRLVMELDLGSERADLVGIVLGNAGHQRGLVLYPGRRPPPETLAGDTPPSIPPPEGTIFLALDAAGVPPDLAERARRYGWPEKAELTPTLFGWGADGPGELTERMAQLLTVALAAVLEHDSRGLQVASDRRPETGGTVAVAGGRARYRLTVEAPPAEGPRVGLRLYSHAVRDDLAPVETAYGLGGVPWTALPELRQRSVLYRRAPARYEESGTGLPVVSIVPPDEAGPEVAARLAEANPVGVTLLDQGQSVVVTLVCDSATFGLAELRRNDQALKRFRERLEAAGGAHGILVAHLRDGEPAPVFGFFECLLRPPARPKRPKRRRL
jgi:hypothetical protein